MPYYMLQVVFTGEAWEAMLRNPENRMESIRPVVEGLGGSVGSVFLAFGEFDVVAIVQFPDNISAGAFEVAGFASGAINTSKTTPLLTMDEGLEMMRKAGSSGYRPPAG